MEVREQVDYLFCSHCNQNDKGNVSGSSDRTKMAPFYVEEKFNKGSPSYEESTKETKASSKEKYPLGHCSEGELRALNSKGTGTEGTLSFPRAKVLS